MTINNVNKEVTNKTARNPKISWLVCANHSNTQLKVALQSCLDQTYTDFELIVVANGLNANKVVASVVEWFETDTRVKTISTPICHLTFSLSLGIHFSKGEFIARMDADDIAYSNRLEKQIHFFINNPEVTVLGTAYDLIDENGLVKKTIFPPTGDKQIRNALIYKNPICHPTVMFRKQTLVEAGGYLGGLQAEDYDLWLRLSDDHKIRFANLKNVCVGYRNTGGEARGSRLSYSSQGSSQIRHFLMGCGSKWLFAAILTFLKIMKLSIRNFLIRQAK